MGHGVLYKGYDSLSSSNLYNLSVLIFREGGQSEHQ